MVAILTGSKRADLAQIALALAGQLRFELFAAEDICSAAGEPAEQVADSWLIALDALLKNLLATGVDAVVTCPALDAAAERLLSREGVRIVSLGGGSEQMAEGAPTLAEGGGEHAVQDILQTLQLVREDSAT